MSAEIWAALIGLAGSAAGSLAGIMISSSLTQYRLKKLEEKVDELKQQDERIRELEKKLAVMEEQIRTLTK